MLVLLGSGRLAVSERWLPHTVTTVGRSTVTCSYHLMSTHTALKDAFPFSIKSSTTSTCPYLTKQDAQDGWIYLHIIAHAVKRNIHLTTSHPHSLAVKKLVTGCEFCHIGNGICQDQCSRNLLWRFALTPVHTLTVIPLHSH